MENIKNPSLEDSIKEEARKVMASIALKEAEEMKRLDDTHGAELEDFKNRTKTRTDAKIRQETSRVENRAALDLKKFKLKSMEAFISQALEEVVKEIRNNPGYKSFLFGSIAEALKGIPAGAEVRLKSEDLVLEGEIREALKASGADSTIPMVEDKTIKGGGCLVLDGPGGRIFDSSIDRICFRKSAEIRREVMRMLDDQSRKGNL